MQCCSFQVWLDPLWAWTFFAGCLVAFLNEQVSGGLGQERQHGHQNHGEEGWKAEQDVPQLLAAQDLAGKHATEIETFGPAKHTHTGIISSAVVFLQHLSPKNWPDSFPTDTKVAEVNVTRPLSFRGEISPRYIRCVLCPKPARPPERASASQWQLGGHTGAVTCLHYQQAN